MACNQQDNELGGVKSENETNNPLFLSIKISGPPTRSTTDNTKPGDSSDGIIEGEINENKIESASVYFFDSATGETIHSFSVDNEFGKIEEKDDSNSSFNIVTEVTEDLLKKLVGRNFNIYILANPISLPVFQDETTFLATTINFTGLDANPLRPFSTGTEGQLSPMANVAKYTVADLANYPKGDIISIQELKEVFREVFSVNYENGRLWKIGQNIPLQLERQVARIDFKDVKNNGFIYPLSGGQCNATGNSEVYLKIVSLQLFNVGKESYTFRHTQPLSTSTGSEDGEIRPFGSEKGSAPGFYNWIADCDWSKKYSGSNSYSYFHQMSSSTGSDGKEQWKFTPITPTTAYTTTAALKAWLNTNRKPSDEFAPWYYVTENTLPSVDLMNIRFATGILFRVLVCNSSGNPLKVDNDGDLIITMPEGVRTVLAKENAKTDPANTSNILEPAGYYLTYKYLIEHNLEKTGSVNGSTGGKNSYAPMQVGLVRNNVYRIKVEAINTLPDPDFGMEVYSYVIPWELRTDDNVLLK
ncbi:MAG: hypothetical protein J1F43_07045 [Muribaculaceae bacterium]|nr:hypothetical protein [Muribaculaceae bacterium]